MKYHLYLYNDHEHTFRYVWTALMEHLGHLPLQAEQCCLIAQNNDRCHVKQSEDIMELRKMETKLKDLDLKVEIVNEKYA